MNYKMMGRFLSLILLMEAVFMLPSLGISLADGTTHATHAFLLSIGAILLAAGILFLFSRRAKRSFFAKEGLFCVGIGWILLSFFGALPFCLSGEIPRYIDALFEIVSGFTTTGASIVANVEGLSRAVAYWRSFSHWLGGMGVLVFLLAIVPVSGKQEGFTMHLLRAESPGPEVGKLVPRMRHTAAVLYLTYIALTVVNVIFLLLGDMDPFESICTALGTAGTGGFGIKNDSMASYSPYIQNVTTVFMLLFGVNFSCYYLILLRRFRAVIRNEELRFYFVVVAVSIFLITLNVLDLYGSVWDSLRHSAFQVSSIITTTGYATTDFDLWPSFSKGILLVLMLIGGCAGSTSGGLKCIRALMLIKSAKRNLGQMIRPQRVKVVRIDGAPADDRVLAATNAYFCIYVLLMVVSFLAVSLDGYSLMTNLSAVITCSNNVGPGFDAVGPTCNFALFSPLSKVVLIFDMLAGRLEIFPILALFSLSTWKKG